MTLGEVTMFRRNSLFLVLVLTLILGFLPTLAGAGQAPPADTATLENQPAADAMAADDAEKILAFPFVPDFGLVLLYCSDDFDPCKCGPFIGFCMDGVCCCD